MTPHPHNDGGDKPYCLIFSVDVDGSPSCFLAIKAHSKDIQPSRRAVALSCRAALRSSLRAGQTVKSEPEVCSSASEVTSTNLRMCLLALRSCLYRQNGDAACPRVGIKSHRWRHREDRATPTSVCVSLPFALACNLEKKEDWLHEWGIIGERGPGSYGLSLALSVALLDAVAHGGRMSPMKIQGR